MKKNFETPLMNISAFDKESIVTESAVGYSQAAKTLEDYYSSQSNDEFKAVLKMVW